MPATHTIQKLLGAAAKFVVDHKGQWEHEDWEAFVGEAQKLGIEDNDENKRELGNILEAAKGFYHMQPATAAKKAKAKPKAKAKVKPKP